jgi:hypothetical protein
VAPQGAATLQATIDALNALGIRVIGLTDQSEGDPSEPVPAVTGPDFSGISMLQALATLTGAVDASGDPLVFPIDSSDTSGLQSAIATAIGTALVTDNDVTLVATTVSPCLGDPAIFPPFVLDVGADESATFTITTLACAPASAVFEVRDVASGATLATAAVAWDEACAPYLAEGTIGDFQINPPVAED